MLANKRVSVWQFTPSQWAADRHSKGKLVNRNVNNGLQVLGQGFCWRFNHKLAEQFAAF